MKDINKLIKAIKEESDIHHNIRINYNKLPDYNEEDYENGFDIMLIAGEYLDMFKEDFEDIEITPMNDNHNRNLCDCKNKHLGCCSGNGLKGKIWSTGRSGSTLYWDEYYKANHHLEGFKYSDYELEEMEVIELEEILEDLINFNLAIKNLMNNYYEGVNERYEEFKHEEKEEAKKEKRYNTILSEIKNKGLKKRLINDLI